MPKYKTGQTEWKSWALGFFSCLFGGSFCLGFFIVVDLFCLFFFLFWGLFVGVMVVSYWFSFCLVLFGVFFWFICRKEKKKNKIGANCKAFSLNFKLV